MKRLRSSPTVAQTFICLILCGPGLVSDGAASAPGDDPFASWYGRAGGPVGADAISAISKSASPAPASAQVQWYGRAGAPVGVDAIETLSRMTAVPDAFAGNAFDGWYGRAGGPVGILSVTTQDHTANSTADAQKRDYVSEISGPSVRSVATGGCVRVEMWVPSDAAGRPPCGAPGEAMAKRPAQPQVTQLPPPPATEAKSVRAETAPEVVREPTPPEVAAAPPAPKPSERVVEPAPQSAEAPLHATLDAATHFGFNKYLLRPSGQTKVDQLLAELAERPFEAIVVTGHTDRIGSKDYNAKLSEQRALSVKAYLAKSGVDAKKIQAHGVGAAEPATPPDACEGLDWAKTIQCLAPDRRVEVVVIGARPR